MQGSIIRTIVLILLLGVTGCANTSHSIAPEVLGPVRYVAVISLLGDTLKSVEVGTSALSNRVIEIMITERHFDRQVTQSLDGHIRNQSAYQVIDQPYDSKVLWRVYAAPKAGPSLDSDYDLKRIREPLQRLAATRHVDAIVLLLAWRAPDYAGHSLGDLPGYGLYRHYFPGVPASTDTYVAFPVHIVWADGATVLGEQAMTAYAKFDDSYWSDGFDGLTLARKDKVVETFVLLMSQRAIAALRELKFL